MKNLFYSFVVVLVVLVALFTCSQLSTAQNKSEANTESENQTRLQKTNLTKTQSSDNIWTQIAAINSVDQGLLANFATSAAPLAIPGAAEPTGIGGQRAKLSRLASAFIERRSNDYELPRLSRNDHFEPTNRHERRLREPLCSTRLHRHGLDQRPDLLLHCQRGQQLWPRCPKQPSQCHTGRIFAAFDHEYRIQPANGDRRGGLRAQAAMAATGGVTPYSWSATGFPNGMSINASSGAPFGTPTVSGTFNVTITVRDSSNPQQTASRVLSLTVNPATAPLSITSTAFNPPTATVGWATGPSGDGGDWRCVTLYMVGDRVPKWDVDQFVFGSAFWHTDCFRHIQCHDHRP